MSSEYTIRNTSLVLFDSPEHIDFHVRSGDYFAYIATMLGSIEETLAASSEEGDDTIEWFRNVAKDLRGDLRYVQAHYAVVPRKPGEIQVIHPKGNLLTRLAEKRS